MKLIAHRGNISGKNPKEENKKEYISYALSKGYDAEIDIHYTDNFYLGHDFIQYKVEKDFLLQKGLWCHAKTIETLEKLLNLGVVCFYHETDKCTLTSNGLIWTFPGNVLTEKSVCVLPEIYNQYNLVCYGICSDYIEKYASLI
jgi:hypothetical protein